MSAPRASIDLQGPVSDGFRTFTTFVPRFLGFLIILVVGYILAKLVAKIVDAVLERVGFDRAVERGGVKQALAKSRYDASDIVAKIAFYFVFVSALSIALGVLGIAALSAPIAALLALLPKILVALVIVVVGAALASAAKKFLANVLAGVSYGNGLANAVSILILVLFAKAALDEVGIATTVTNAVLYTALAIIAGVTIVGVGGGLVRPMQARWEDMLNKAAQERDTLKQQVQQQRAQQSPYPTDPVYGTQPPVYGAAPLTSPLATPPAPDATQVVDPTQQYGMPR